MTPEREKEIEEVTGGIVSIMRRYDVEERRSIINRIGSTFCMLCGKDEEEHGKCYCSPRYDL